MISPELLAHVKASEGVRLTPYRDAAGVWTIGYGATGPEITMTCPRWTMDQAEARLASDLQHFHDAVLHLCPDVTGARLDSLTDFCFNLGTATLAKSSIPLKVTRGDYINAANTIRQYTKAHVKGVLTVLPGLVARREVEAKWMESGVYA